MKPSTLIGALSIPCLLGRPPSAALNAGAIQSHGTQQDPDWSRFGPDCSRHLPSDISADIGSTHGAGWISNNNAKPWFGTSFGPTDYSGDTIFSASRGTALTDGTILVPDTGSVLPDLDPVVESEKTEQASKNEYRKEDSKESHNQSRSSAWTSPDTILTTGVYGAAGIALKKFSSKVGSEWSKYTSRLDSDWKALSPIVRVAAMSTAAILAAGATLQIAQTAKGLWDLYSGVEEETPSVGNTAASVVNTLARFI